MHISDGIISTPVCIAADVAAVALIYVSSRKVKPEEIPGMGLTGASLFVTSLIHFPLAGSSVHLGLLGIAGIILGKRSFPVIFTVVLFQSLIFQHGGLITVGVNAINMGAGAWSAWLIWRMIPVPEYIRALLAGFVGILVPAVLMVIEFQITGYGTGIVMLLLVYLLSASIEAGITMWVVAFFRKVKPDILTMSKVKN